MTNFGAAMSYLKISHLILAVIGAVSASATASALPAQVKDDAGYSREFIEAQSTETMGHRDEFRFNAAGWACRVRDKGEGECSLNGVRWRLKLPTDGGLISSFFVAPGQNILIAYSVDSSESVWSVAANIVPRQTKPKWQKRLPTLNMAPPILSSEKIVVASALSVSSISAKTGEWVWRHHWVYDNSGNVIPEVSVSGLVLKLRVHQLRSSLNENAQTTCFSLDYGTVVPC
jgi:hypothetical protein